MAGISCGRGEPRWNCGRPNWGSQPGWVGSGRARVRLPMPKNQVAAYLGTTPETFSRRLAALERDGLVELGPGREVRILDPAGLSARA